MVTPVPVEEMNMVNCLTMGAVTLPTGIIENQIKQLSEGHNRKVRICFIVQGTLLLVYTPIIIFPQCLYLVIIIQNYNFSI